MTARRRLRQLLREEGQAAVEFALVAPVLIALLLAIVQGGIAFNHYLAVTDAARAGERVAEVARFSGGSVADVTTAVQNAAAGLDPSQLKVSVSDPTDPTFQTSGSTLTVTVTYPYSIDVLGWAVSSGNLTSTITGRLE